MTDESLFREVDEEVRQEEYQKLWQRHGKLIMAVAALVIAIFGGFRAWQYYERTQAESAGVFYFDAMKKAADGKFDDAMAALKGVNRPGYGQLAKLKEAGILAEKGDTEQAVALYDAIAADGAIDAVLKDVARIRAGYLLVDSAKPDDLLGRLGQFDKGDSPWRHQVREIFGLAAWRSGDYAMADRYMNAIVADAETPPALRQRAQMMIQLITPRLPPK